MKQPDLFYRYRPLKINVKKQYKYAIMLSNINQLPTFKKCDKDALYLVKNQEDEIEVHWSTETERHVTHLTTDKLKNINIPNFLESEVRILEFNQEENKELINRIISVCYCNYQKDIIDEIENQELFLATLEENNDPMDGIQEIFWKGDRVFWKQFIEHYFI